MAQKVQTLDETLLDLKKIGKGLLVGETADILGLPADLMGLYYDLRYGETPEGIQSLIDTVGSEALAKKFMGEEFPEFGMNLESAGRVMAPGALLTKAIASARLAARLKDTLPPGGGIGDLATETVGVGAARVDDVPRTTSEILAMTRADGTGGGTPKREIDEVYFKDDVDPEARLNVDGTIFSNLLDEIAKNGLGIDFSKPRKGSEIKTYIETLPKGVFKQRANAEALELGLFRYLENNPDEVFKSKDDLLDVATLFKPQLNVSVGTLQRKKTLEREMANLRNEIAQVDPSDPRYQMLEDEIKVKTAELDLYSSMKQNIMSNESAQRIPVGMAGGQSQNQKSLVEEDTVHFVFHGDTKGGDATIIGKQIESIPELRSKQEKELAKVEDYFKAVGNTTDLAKLGSFKRHGFNFPGYMAHARGVGVESPNVNDPANPFKDLVINEIQSNQGGVKEISIARDNIKAQEKIKKLEKELNDGTISSRDRKTLDNLKRKQVKSPYGDMMTNEKRADALQIIKEDEKLNTGFFKYSEKRGALSNNAQKEFENLQQAEKDLTDLENTMGPYKEAVFKTDAELNQNKIALDDFRKAKSKIKEDLLKSGSHRDEDVDYQMPKFLAGLFNFVEGRTAEVGKQHLSGSSLRSVLEYGGNNADDFSRNIRKLSKERYDVEGDLDPFLDIVAGFNPIVVQDRFEDFRRLSRGETDIQSYPDMNNLADSPISPFMKDYEIIDIDMTNDFYETVTKGFNQGRITKDDFERMVGRFGATTPGYKEYIRAYKLTYGDNIFQDPKVVDKITGYLLNDKERKLEMAYLKSQAYNKFVNDPAIGELLESDNILEIATRLEDLRRRQPNFSKFTDAEKIEYKKIKQDFATDFEINLLSFNDRGRPGDILSRKTKEVIDEWMSVRGNQIPRFYTSAGMSYDLGRASGFKSITTIPRIEEPKRFLGKLTKIGVGREKAIYDPKLFIENFGKQTDAGIAHALTDRINSQYFQERNIALDALIAKKNMMNMDESIAHLESIKNDAVDRLQEANRKIDEFDQKNDKTQILNDLKSKLPDKLKNSLDMIVRHQEGIEKLLENPAFSSSKQATELMVHQIINQAKKLGYDRVVFPNVESYLAAGGRGGTITRKAYGEAENRVPYNFSIGSNVTEALKKYNPSAYSTQSTYMAFKKEMQTQGGPVIPRTPINFGVQSRQNPVEDDKFRIINLKDMDVSKKVGQKMPRMAKGGILNRFRKAS